MKLDSVAFSIAIFFLTCSDWCPDASGQTAVAATITPTGEVELVQDGFVFTEGPAWEPKSGSLFFSDIPNTAIYRLNAEGSVTRWTDQSKHTNGILVDRNGRMLACQMDGQVVQYDIATAEATVLASEFEGQRFNAPNDLTVDAGGGIYFTDPLFRAPTPLPQTVQAVYYIAAGKVARVTGDLAAPNGVGLSPDGKRLYVCPSRQAEMLVYEVLGPGKLSEPRIFCTVDQPEGQTETGADGITLDIQGNVYITTHIGVQVFSPDGKQLGVISFPQQPSNVCFGGRDRKTMYVTARTALYSVIMPIPGLH